MSVKFRNPKTGEILNDYVAFRGDFCCEYSCDICPVGKKTVNGLCQKWIHAHPLEAAELMGYEVVEEEEATMENIKPRICEILGLDIDKEFTVKNEDGIFHINNIGQVTTGVFLMNPRVLCDIINHPEKIESVITFSDEEVAQIKAIKTLYPNVKYIEQINGGTDDSIVILSDYEHFISLQHLGFPSLPADKKINITKF